MSNFYEYPYLMYFGKSFNVSPYLRGRGIAIFPLLLNNIKGVTVRGKISFKCKNNFHTSYNSFIDVLV